MALKERVYDEKYVREKIRKILENAEQQYGHRKLIEKCRKLQKKCEDNEDLFFQEFMSALKYVFFYHEKTAAEHILSFVSKFVVMYANFSDQNKSDSTIDECSPFVTSILEFLFKSHKAYSPDARLRSIQLLDKILSGMPENSLISDEIWQKLKETVLCRLQDKNLAVRVQAVITARKLQDPKNPNCEIIKALIFHFNDPSPAVRRAVVSSIALNKLTIIHVLARTRDVNDNVRRNAYLVFCKIKVMHLTIKFRVTILERGLQDRSGMVKKCVEQVLVVKWLENFNKSILKFLEALDVVNCSEIAIKTVEAILKTQPKDEIMKQLPIDDETHLIPMEKMTPESVLLWRCLAHYFWVEGSDEDLDAILPSLTLLCNHIRGFYKLEETENTELNEEEQWAEVKQKETLMHLLQLLKVFDLSDEMGRLKLKELVTDMLISPRISNCQVKYLVELLVPVIPSKDAFINELTEVISEIRQPMRIVVKEIPQKEKMERELKISDLKVTLNELREQEYNAVSNKNYAEAQELKNLIEAVEAELKACMDQPVTLTQEVSEEKNDPVVLCKCLSILVEMIRFSNVKSLTPRLLNLKENFLNQCMSSRDLLTQSLAIEALSQFCILDKELAKDNLVRFILMISEDGDNEITIPSLKGVFDIIHTHGLECFEHLYMKEENEEQGAKNRIFREESFFEEPNDSFNDVRCLKNLNALLSYKNNDALKSIAYEGLCKLLLSGVTYSPSVLTRIIVKGFSPIIECEYEDFIRQTFMVFFPIFASNTPRSQEMIEEAFMPTMKTIENSPLGTPEADINPKSVITFLLAYTRPDINKHTAKSLHVHNNLALSIGHEIYKDLCEANDSVFFLQIYLRALNELEISLESESFVQQLTTLTNKIEKSLKEATCIRLLCNFKKKVEEKLQMNVVVSSVENTLATTRDSRTSKKSTDKSMKVSETSGDCSSDKKSAQERRALGPSAACESMDTSEIHESFSSTLPGSTSEMIIPESPEMSE